MVPFESLDTVSYCRSIVTMVVCCIISEIKRAFGGKSRFFNTPSTFDAPVRGEGSSEFCHTVCCGKIRIVWLSHGGGGVECKGNMKNRDFRPM